MKVIAELGAKVDREWKSAGHSLDSFSQVATRILTELTEVPTSEQLENWVADWLLNEPKLPAQISVYNSFGQPSVTLFNNGRFVIDLYFWVDFDTSIHSHGFRGAFRVLQGQSLHETFHTPVTRAVSEDVRIVEMSQVEREILKPNDVRTISPGLELTHRVVHLENPTITLCIRTINEDALKQWTYLPSGLSIRKEEVSADLIKKVLYFQYLFGRDAAKALQFLKGLLTACSLSEQIHLYEEVASGLFGLRAEVSQALVEEIVDRHEGADWWKLYEAAHLARMNELSFEHCQNSRERLVGHFINSKLSYKHPLLGVDLDQAAEIAQGLLAANDPSNPAQIELVNRFLA